VLIVVNPNSPSGTTVGSDAVYALAARRPDALVCLDESFIDFSGERSIIERLEREPLPNVVVLTSLSKSLGVPGLRLGFAYSADPSFVARLGAALPVWNLSAPAEYLLELLLKYRNELDVSIQRTIDDRGALAADLAGVPLVDRVFPSGGNFLLARLAGGDPTLGARVRQRLLADHRIEVKDVSGRFGRPEACLRIAVRRAEDNARLVTALAAVAASIAVSAR
jgi:histidinol-phosphate/aromatic aminotransferase/cobyric acid decarboxylase-like protein